MSIVKLNIDDKNIILSCSDGQEERLHNAANEVSQKISQLRQMKTSKPITTEVLLAICALELQDELISIKHKVNNQNNTDDLSSLDLNILDRISSYIEKLRHEAVMQPLNVKTHTETQSMNQINELNYGKNIKKDQLSDIKK